MNYFYTKSLLACLLLTQNVYVYVYADTIKINSPSTHQVINNSSININYTIQRNGMLYISNTTTELLDVNNKSLVSFLKDVNTSPNVLIDMRTFVQPNTTTNFTLKITGYGSYNQVNGTKEYSNIQEFVPIQLDLNKRLSTDSSTDSSTTTTTTTTTTDSSMAYAYKVETSMLLCLVGFMVLLF